jgi:hypothetical protein
LDISSNSIGYLLYVDPRWTLGINAAKTAVEYTHTDGRVQTEEPEKEAKGAIAVANAIKDMGAISSVNLLKNNISVEQAQELVKIMQSKEKLTTLCGLSRKETMLDFSKQGLGPGDAMLIANDIKDMGALTSLDISSNSLRVEGTKLLANALGNNQTMTSLNVSSNYMTYGSDMTGVTALADAIPDMGALSKLNVRGNNISEKARLQSACDANGVSLSL